jgi:hypothetical protein
MVVLESVLHTREHSPNLGYQANIWCVKIGLMYVPVNIETKTESSLPRGPGLYLE